MKVWQQMHTPDEILRDLENPTGSLKYKSNYIITFTFKNNTFIFQSALENLKQAQHPASPKPLMAIQTIDVLRCVLNTRTSFRADEYFVLQGSCLPPSNIHLHMRAWTHTHTLTGMWCIRTVDRWNRCRWADSWHYYIVPFHPFLSHS